jgi:hypothetical protein
VKLSISASWRVEAEGSVDIPLPAPVVWGQMRDYRGFLSLDPLHARIDVVSEGEASPRGDRLLISHRLMGMGPNRSGRVLRWREGTGYAISDLSRRGNRSGFPHVCTYELRSLGPERSRLVIGARGRWTATRVPRWAAKVWLWWVLKGTQARISAELARFGAWRSARAFPCR